MREDVGAAAASSGFCSGSDPGVGYLSLIQLTLLGAPVQSLQLANTQLANTQLANTQLANTQLANTQLANTQLALGFHDRALTLCSRACRTLEDHLGADHAETLSGSNLLAQAYRVAGRMP